MKVYEKLMMFSLLVSIDGHTTHSGTIAADVYIVVSILLSFLLVVIALWMLIWHKE